MTTTKTTPRTERDWYMEWAKGSGYHARLGGWVYNRAGFPVCQGWDKFFEYHVPQQVKSHVREWVNR